MTGISLMLNLFKKQMNETKNKFGTNGRREKFASTFSIDNNTLFSMGICS